MSIRCRVTALCITSTVLISPNRLSLSQGGPPVSLTLACQQSSDRATNNLALSLRNTAAEDIAVVLGSAIGNGRTYMIEGLTLQLQRVAGVSGEEYRYRPRSYPAAVAGRVDDWILPLIVGASFSLTLAADDFVSATYERPKAFPSEGDIRLQLRCRPPRDGPERRLVQIWTGTITSRAIRLPSDCQ